MPFRRRQRFTRKRRRRGAFRGRSGMRRSGRFRRVGLFGRFDNSTRHVGTGQEYKRLDTLIQAQVGNTGSVVKNSINTFAQGAGVSQRIGQKAIIKKISMKGSWKRDLEGNADNGTMRCRFIVFLDQQCNGQAVTPTDLLASNSLIAYRALSETARIKVLWDKTIQLQPTAAVYDVVAAEQHWGASQKVGALVQISLWNFGGLHKR